MNRKQTFELSQKLSGIFADTNKQINVRQQEASDIIYNEFKRVADNVQGYWRRNIFNRTIEAIVLIICGPDSREKKDSAIVYPISQE